MDYYYTMQGVALWTIVIQCKVWHCGLVIQCNVWHCGLLLYNVRYGTVDYCYTMEGVALWTIVIQCKVWHCGLLLYNARCGTVLYNARCVIEYCCHSMMSQVATITILWVR